MAWSLEEREAAEALADLAYANPFGQHRELTRRALSDETTQPGVATDALELRAAALLERAAVDRDGAPDPTVVLGLTRHRLGSRLRELFDALGEASATGTLTRRRVASFRLFDEEVRRIGAPALEGSMAPGHLFAVMFQEHRAQTLIAKAVPGDSENGIALRRAAWESVFTRDRRRYERLLFSQMCAFPVLVSGPPGGSQAAVAAAVARSVLLPFDTDTLRFAAEARASVVDARQPPAVVTAALFGAASVLASTDSVMLAHVEELAPPLQARLAAALETGSFIPDDAPELLASSARLVATYEGDLERAVANGRMRRDLWDALAVDLIEVAPLGERLRAGTDDLRRLVRQALEPMLSEGALDIATAEVLAWLQRNREGYDWPGDLSELRRTVRAALVREPAPATSPAHSTAEQLMVSFARGELSADRMLEAYCTLAYAAAGSYQDAARRLGLDRRTVKARIDRALLAELKGDES